VQLFNPAIARFEASCFSGEYITGDVTPEYLAGVEARRNDPCGGQKVTLSSAQLDLNLTMAD